MNFHNFRNGQLYTLAPVGPSVSAIELENIVVDVIGSLTETSVPKAAPPLITAPDGSILVPLPEMKTEDKETARAIVAEEGKKGLGFKVPLWLLAVAGLYLISRESGETKK